MTQCFEIVGGDGDQSVLGANLRLSRIQRDWFDGTVNWAPDYTATGYLTKVTSEGEYKGRLIAITSNILTHIDDAFQMDGAASLIVHLVDEGFSKGTINSKNSSAVGKASVYKCGCNDEGIY
jgi:hypothetical protein